jgi:hypothetical protein
MSKKAIKRLSDAFPSYDLNVAATTLTEKGTLANGQAGLVNVPAYQITITIFEHGEKGAVITKKSSAYGLDQDSAIEQAVERLGV